MRSLAQDTRSGVKRLKSKSQEVFRIPVNKQYTNNPPACTQHYTTDQHHTKKSFNSNRIACNITPEAVGSRAQLHATSHHKALEIGLSSTQPHTKNLREVEHQIVPERAHARSGVGGQVSNSGCAFRRWLLLNFYFGLGQTKLQIHGNKGRRIPASSAAAILQRFSVHTFNENHSHIACSDRHHNLPPLRQEKPRKRRTGSWTRARPNCWLLAPVVHQGTALMSWRP